MKLVMLVPKRIEFSVQYICIVVYVSVSGVAAVVVVVVVDQLFVLMYLYILLALT